MPATGIVDSNTRPFNPSIGDRIFETDTGKILYWYGPYFQWFPQWGGSRLLGWAEGNSAVAATNDALTITIPYRQLQGRQVYWIANFPINRASGVTGIYQLVDAANTVLDSRNFSTSTAAAQQLSVTIGHRENFPPSQQVDVTRKLRVAGGTIPAGSTYNLFCFDESFGISLQGHIPLWDTAIWDTDQWGSD